MESFLKNCKKKIATAFLVVTVVAIGTSQATIVSLGTAADFAVLGGSAVANADASTFVTGDAGSSSTSSMIGLTFANVDGVPYLAADTAMVSAHMDLIAEYNAAVSILLDGVGVAEPVDLGETLFTTGVHTCATTAPWTAGVLTLDGQFNPSAQWVFQIVTDLTTPADTTVSLINSTSANNVFWQIGSSLTLGVNNAFAGNIIANTSITLKAERGKDI
jgi:hypothetical protein